MGRNVTDTIKLLTTMAGYDARDPLSLRDSIPKADAFFAAPLTSELRIGWLGDYGGYLPTEPGLLELCRGSLNQLEKQGVIVEECALILSLLASGNGSHYGTSHSWIHTLCSKIPP